MLITILVQFFVPTNSPNPIVLVFTRSIFIFLQLSPVINLPDRALGCFLIVLSETFMFKFSLVSENACSEIIVLLLIMALLLSPNCIALLY